MKRILSILLGVSASLLVIPLATFAVNLTEKLTVVLPVDSSSVTFDSGGTFNALEVTTNKFILTLDPGDSVTIRDTQKRNLTNTRDIATVCDSNESRLTHSVSSGAGVQVVITTTPSGTCATSSAAAASTGGGSGGGGGGGGGGSSTAAATPTPSPTPVASSTPVAAVPATPAIPAVPGTPATPGASGTPAIAATPATPATPAIPATPAVIITRALTIGSQGTDVTSLQQFLATDPTIYPEGTVSGYFGPKTLAAIKRFQVKYGIAKEGDSGYGILGPKTRAKIKELSSQATSSVPVAAPSPSVSPSSGQVVSLTRTLSSGSQGTDVTSLQQFLATDPTIYPEGTVSGYFGPKTQAAIQRFQEKYGIAASGQTGYGIAGPKTRAKIQELSGSSTPVPTGTPTPAPSPSSPSTEDLQKQLKVLEDMLKQLQK